MATTNDKPGFSGLSLVLTGAVIATLVIFGIQQRQINRLQAENQRLLALQQKAAPLDSAAKDELARLRKSEPELLRLRDEVAQLRREQGSAKQPSSRRTSLSRGPGGFISKSQLVKVGFATPEAALQSFMAAALSGDYDQVLAAMAPDEKNQAAEDRDQGRLAFEKAFREEFGSFRGMQMLGKKVLSDARTDIQILILGDRQPPELMVQHLVRIGTEWRFAGSANDPDWPLDGQVVWFIE